MQHYDFVLAGGGLAGLSLAHALVSGPYPQRSILIVDPEEKGENDRTWSFWSKGCGPHDDIVHASWPRASVESEHWSGVFDLGQYRYSTIRGIDFYEKVLADLERAPGVEFERGRVTAIAETDAAAPARVTTETRTVSAGWVFDSRFDPKEYESRSGPHHYLKQHFLGWTIQAERPEFREDVATLFDFRTPQKGGMRFVYILPFSGDRALVEYTLFTADLLPAEEYVEELERYIADVLGLSSYRVIDRESGVIPMTDEPAPRRLGPRTLAIGTKGGRVKASTGYAFHRTQTDTAAIVDSLVHYGDPFHLPRPPRRVHALDSTMLHVMRHRGELMERTFTGMFARNPIDRMLRFLDEETTIPETLAVMASVPILPFLKAFIQTQVLRKY